MVKREDEDQKRFGRNGVHQERGVHGKAGSYFCDEKKCLLLFLTAECIFW